MYSSDERDIPHGVGYQNSATQRITHAGGILMPVDVSDLNRFTVTGRLNISGAGIGTLCYACSVIESDWDAYYGLSINIIPVMPS